MSEPARRELGHYIVADPDICHGPLTFRGTRVFVADILDDVAHGTPWDEIVRNWHGVTLEAIAEAVQLAREALLTQEPTPTAV